LSIVAFEGEADTHAFEAAGVLDPTNCVVEPIQTNRVPVIIGFSFTVTVTVCEQPVVFVYVITAVPADIPVIIPTLLTPATDVFAESHGLEAFAVPEPFNVMVEPSHTVVPPEILGNGFTETEIVLEITEEGDAHNALLVIATEYTSPFTAFVVEYEVPVAAGVIATPFLRQT
jgi:hypothetical protein